MLCDKGYFLAGWVKRGSLARVAQGSMVGKRPRQKLRLTEEDLVVVFPDQTQGPHSPNHENQAMLENSSHIPTDTTSHEIIGNFMTKMTELLEATLASGREERTQSTSNDEALEQFLRL
ncbi:hypothetical protein M9H77_12101 [Catharanthus roseus]|uniref:Uncharacterized protein n=1 Tax=Catharanthus roseus TaxID=4058 RepID=A0ACC0BGG6_CATRO|nr:hypothetical protein M9H77_12101 [Catharanthus roseus]